jgi:hypothetical protein
MLVSIGQESENTIMNMNMNNMNTNVKMDMNMDILERKFVGMRSRTAPILDQSVILEQI